MRFWNRQTILIFLTLVVIFLTRFSFLGHAIYGDGIYYWAYTRSIALDRDLDLRNESVHRYYPEGNNSPETSSPAEDTQLTDNKYYPIGTSLSWLPAFLSAHSLSHVFGYLPNGYSDIYQVTVGVFSISLVIVALSLIWKTLRMDYSGFTSWMSLALLIFSTSLVYYSSLDVLNTHSLALLFTAFAVYVLFQNLRTTLETGFLYGLIAGLASLTRPQDSLVAILFLPGVLKAKDKRCFLAFLLGGMAGYLPQLGASLVIFGNFLSFPYLTGGDVFNPFSPHVLELIFDTKRGLIYFSPIFLASIAGLVLYFRNKKPFAGRLLLLTAAQFGVISIWSGWSQGEAYGMRMLISLIPVFGLGLAELIAYLENFLSRRAIVLIGVFFIVQNLVMILGFHIFMHEPTFVDGQLSEGGKIKQEILLELEGRFN